MSLPALPPHETDAAWTPYATASAQRRQYQCSGCGKTTKDVRGWWWRWIEAEDAGRFTDTLCGQCFNRIRKHLESRPRCTRCGSTKLCHDTVGTGTARVPRTTCETCAAITYRPDPALHYSQEACP